MPSIRSPARPSSRQRPSGLTSSRSSEWTCTSLEKSQRTRKGSSRCCTRPAEIRMGRWPAFESRGPALFSVPLSAATCSFPFYTRSSPVLVGSALVRVNCVALRMNLPPAEIHGVASFYAMFSLSPARTIVAHVCDDIACMARGAGALCAELEKSLGPAESANARSRATWRRGPCLGLCERSPAALISSAGETPRECVVAPATANTIQSALHDC